MILKFLALAFGLHVVMVNLGIGLSAIIPFTKRRAELNGDAEMLRTAKNLMKFYASTYGLAGVFGTAFTVFLLSFYPAFLGLAGHITFVPFGLSICLIALHFLALTLYWYGWDKFSSEKHFAIGIIMMVSAILIPLGFRAIFGFLNVPMGLELQPKLHLDVLKALSNPTFLALYPKSIFASFSVTFVVLATAFAYRRRELALKFAKLGLICLIATAVFGIIYAETLRIYASYKYSNAFAFLGLKASYDVSWMFLLKMAFVTIQFVALILFIVKENNKLMPLAGFSALAGVFMGEMLNAFSQYPYLIVNVSGLPPEVVNALADIINMAKPNPIATMESLYLITLAFLIPLLASASLLVYLVLKPEES
ncbi:cytochrome ubiquinol oxidase subunit I [Archaeoglobus sp.]